LGWTEEQTLAADVNAIMVGMSGRWAMLEAVFGADQSAPSPPQPQPATQAMTPELFDAVFAE
jgi:hypothetical protein